MSRGHIRSNTELLPQVEIILTQTVFQVQLTYMSKHIFHITTIQTGTLVSEKQLKKNPKENSHSIFIFFLFQGVLGKESFPACTGGRQANTYCVSLRVSSRLKHRIFSMSSLVSLKQNYKKTKDVV